ncbi:hypothetical protein [Pedobacter sp. L105]|uniref:hypothetical protein n=1 Tax=Pedobacter sp. L105 TaxID=1641871 RepID=UPI00131E474E|nr:hypothetical protein [Pedobacter sp. L105]
MKKLFILLFISVAGLSYTGAFAQDPDEDVNLWVSQPVVVDGNSSEWHEPLNNYNTPTKLAFALANDQNNLYLIIESLDEITTGKLLRAGLTLNINTAGKKKDGIKLKFLGMQQPPPPHQPGDSLNHARPEANDSLAHHYPDRDHADRDPGVHVIQVSGFEKIPDGSLAIPNNSGIQVAAAFNKQRDYICELAIPLGLLDLKDKKVKGIAYNIKINAPDKAMHHDKGAGDMPAGGGGMSGGGMHGGGGGGGMGGGMGGGRHGGGGGGGKGMRDTEGSGNTDKPDFWIKYELAKPADSFRAN